MSLLTDYEKWVNPEPVDHTIKDFPRVVALMGDIHIGARTCDFVKLQAHLALVKKERAGIILMGDQLEAVTTSSKVAKAGAVYEQFNPTDGRAPIDWQFDAFVETFKGQRVLGALNGNHSERLRREGFDIAGHLARTLGAVNLGVLASIRMGKGKFLVSHGEGGGNKHLEYRLRDWGWHEVVAGGHTHQLSVNVITQAAKTGYMIRTGSYLGTARYAMVKQYTSPSSPTGSVLVYLDTDGRPESVRILT